MHFKKIPVLISVVVSLGVGLVREPAPEASLFKKVVMGPPSIPSQPERVVFLGGKLADEDLIVLTAGVAAMDHAGVLLLDTPGTRPHIREFLAAFQAKRIIPVGSFPDGPGDLERCLGMPLAPALEWKQGRPAALWQAVIPQAERVVVCPVEPRGLLLQSACLAGAAKAPLYAIRNKAGEAAELRRWLAGGRIRVVFAAGDTARICRDLPDVQLVELADEAAVAASYLDHQLKKGPIGTLVVANPADNEKDRGGMSTLAPWVALQRRAALLLTNSAGDNTAAVVRAALQNPELHQADALILVAGLRAIPMDSRSNPAAGKDTLIEMEPFTPEGAGPFTFATGRLFHKDRNVVALMLARQRLLAEGTPRRKALVASNPGGHLPLLEVFSRHTALELHNCGYQVTALFNGEVSKDRVRRLLPE
jgi:hypothetical protein